MLKPYYSAGGVDIYHANALDLIESLPPCTVDALVTDPPYSSGGQFRGDRVASAVSKYVQSGTLAYRPDFGGDNRDQRSFFAWCAWWLTYALAVAKPSAHALIFSDWRQVPTTTDAVQAGGWVWRGLGTWHKPGIRMQRGGLSHSAEYVIWGTNGPWSREHDYSPQNVFRCAPVASATKVHVAEKPEDVMAWLVRLAPIGGVVLDPFMGSGATLAAAKAFGRRAIGGDVDERYCEEAAKRLEAVQLPILLEAPSQVDEVPGLFAEAEGVASRGD